MNLTPQKVIFRFEYAFIGVSTSGAPGKHPGRVGDSALPGGGLYASRCFKFYKATRIANFYEYKKEYVYFHRCFTRKERNIK